MTLGDSVPTAGIVLTVARLVAGIVQDWLLVVSRDFVRFIHSVIHFLSVDYCHIPSPNHVTPANPAVSLSLHLLPQRRRVAEFRRSANQAAAGTGRSILACPHGRRCGTCSTKRRGDTAARNRVAIHAYTACRDDDSPNTSWSELRHRHALHRCIEFESPFYDSSLPSAQSLMATLGGSP